MPRAAWNILAFVTILGTSCSGWSADTAGPDSIWEGALRVQRLQDGKPKIGNHDCRLVVLERSDARFTGEFWWDNDTRGVAIEGTIDKGAMRFTCAKDLRGDSSDLVGNVRVVGRFRGKDKNELQLRFVVPGTNHRTGEIKLKLKE